MSESQPAAGIENTRDLRDRAITPEERREWTISVAAEVVTNNTNVESALVFRIGREWLALPTSAFLEVAPISFIHSLPHRAAGGVLGVANVRGELLTCISIGAVLQVSDSGMEGKAEGRFLVVENDGHRFVIQVDEVDRVRRYDPEALIAVPATLERSKPRFTRGMLRINDRTIGCLDAAVLMTQVDRVFE